MINERLIAEKFSAIWKQSFPLLTPTFIKIYNETQVDQINVNPVDYSEHIRFDLVSEAAFNLSEISIINKITPALYLNNIRAGDSLMSIIRENFWTETGYSPISIPFTEEELNNVQRLAENICEFIFRANGKFVKFRPRLKGYGLIPDLEADLVVDDTLYEIKTVTRNFKSVDLRQLFIYLALNHVSKANNWKYAGLYNPRKGKSSKFNVNNLIYNLSGGNPPIEAFENLLNGIVRDIQIDASF